MVMFMPYPDNFFFRGMVRDAYEPAPTKRQRLMSPPMAETAALGMCGIESAHSSRSAGCDLVPGLDWRSSQQWCSWDIVMSMDLSPRLAEGPQGPTRGSAEQRSTRSCEGLSALCCAQRTSERQLPELRHGLNAVPLKPGDSCSDKNCRMDDIVREHCTDIVPFLDLRNAWCQPPGCGRLEDNCRCFQNAMLISQASEASMDCT